MQPDMLYSSLCAAPQKGQGNWNGMENMETIIGFRVACRVRVTWQVRGNGQGNANSYAVK